MRMRTSALAFAIAKKVADPRKLLGAAKAMALAGPRANQAGAKGLNRYVLAVIASRHGEIGSACKLLAEAISAFESVDMRLFAAATRCRLGRMIGGDEDKLLLRMLMWMLRARASATRAA